MPGQNGQSPTDSNSEGDTSANAPGLTVGQRLLLKLPDLGRNKSVRSEPDIVDEPKRAISRPAAPKAPRDLEALDNVEADENDHVEDVEVVDESADATTASRPSSSRSTSGSTSRSGRPTPASVYDKMPTSQLTVLMRKLDDKERLLAFIAAPLGVVLAIVVTLVAVHSNPALHKKGHESPGLILTDGGIGVAFSLFVFGMAWLRRRSLTAFALLFLGYSIGLLGPGTPFLFLGGYLLFRAWRVQKILTSRGVNTRSQSPKRTSGTSGRAPRDPKGRRDSQVKAATSTRPTASKRYTPPKPPPKRPPVAKPEKAAGS